MKNNNDQRANRRFKYEAVIWHDNILPDRFYAARIFNISRSGLYFESDQALYRGEEIYMGNKNPESSDRHSECCTQVEIKWRKDLQDAAYRYGYGAKFLKPDNIFLKSIDKSELVKQNIQGNHARYKKEPRAHLRELYRQAVKFMAKNDEYKGIVTDISRGGAFIQTKGKLSLGAMVNLYIQGSQSCNDVNIKGWVVRLSPNGIGVKFDRRLRGDRRKKSDRRESREKKSIGA